MRMAIWLSLPYKKLITLLGGEYLPADTLFLPKQAFFPTGFWPQVEVFIVAAWLTGLLDCFPCISKSFCIAYFFCTQKSIYWDMGWGPALTRGGGNVRVLLAPYSATSRELSGAAKASLRLGLGYPLYTPQACSLLPPPSVRLSLLLRRLLPTSLPYRPLPSTPYVTHARLACSLPYTWAILPHSILYAQVF